MHKIHLNTEKSRGQISRNIYGHFSEHLGRCIYQGLYVGENSEIPNKNGMRSAAVEALRKIKTPVLRWPGGCFADEYHWRDGIGAKDQRRRMVNSNWGGVVEDNSFGTHEFLELCSQIGCEPYINANMGSGTVQEMAEWLEYLNAEGDSTVAQERRNNGREKPWQVRFWGIGNENWGCGGRMLPEYYANEYRRYQTFCKKQGNTPLVKIACGPDQDDYAWTETVMRMAHPYMDALTLHYYTRCNDDRRVRGSATEFTEEEYYRTLVKAGRMDELIDQHTQIMSKYDPEHRIGLIVDEWGTWFDVEPGTNPGFLYQQNTMRDAMVAAMTLNIFNQHCDRVIMANLAQTVNVLQSVLLTDGKDMILTPTYHVFDLYQNHQDAREIDCAVETEMIGQGDWRLPQLSASASEKNGVLTVTIANLSADQSAEVFLEGISSSKITGRILQGTMKQYNDFDQQPLCINPFTDMTNSVTGTKMLLPACCVVSIEIVCD